jgi:hypothetical protein
MPRIKARGEVFEILYEFKRGDMDIGEAYDLIFDEISGSYGTGLRKKGFRRAPRAKPKRKLSAWNKFVKQNSKKPRFRLRSGKLNLKKLGVAFRKTPAGKKRKR